MTALERLEDFMRDYDADLEFAVCSVSAWSGQLRLTLTNPRTEPSRSITFWSVGGMGPEPIARILLRDAKAWLKESSAKPLPPPS